MKLPLTMEGIYHLSEDLFVWKVADADLNIVAFFYKNADAEEFIIGMELADACDKWTRTDNDTEADNRVQAALKVWRAMREPGNG